jgi:uncharacterized protein YjiS (DUF1127 family)
MSAERLPHPLAADGVEPVSQPRPALVSFLLWLSSAFDRAGQRRALAELTDDQLDDIGLSRREASMEAAKPFWKP